MNTRNTRQAVFDQGKLENAKIAIVGAGALSNYLCTYLSGLGIRNITLVDSSPYQNSCNEFLLKGFKGYKVYGLEEKIRELNPYLKVTAINSPFMDFLIGQPDVLVDLTNDPESKKKCKEASKKIKSVKKVISASSSENNGSIRIHNINKWPLILKRNQKDVLVLKKDDFLLDSYKDVPQGSFTSGLIAAIVLDEIRKVVVPLGNEQALKKGVNFSLYSEERFNSCLKFDEKKDGLSNLDVLVVGAGGIGTYVCLNLVLMGVGNIDLYDGDVIEDHNLNRQVFYYDAVGQKKADVLAARLNRLNKCIKPYPTYLEDTSKLRKYDIIFSCLDNWKYRFMLSDFAIKNRIPFVNGSVTTFSAYVDFCNCLSCKYDAKSLLEDEKKDGSGSGSCANIENSNVVMANAFAGAMMASEAKALTFPEKYKPLYKKELIYDSQSSDSLKLVLTDQLLSCLCHKKTNGCECHELYETD